MSVNLMTVRAADNFAQNWAQIKAAAANDEGMVFINEDTVNNIARLLDGQQLSDGSVVSTYCYEDDDDMAALVASFGPRLLPTMVQDQVRDRLAAGENGKQAARLFDTIVRLGLQVSLMGKEYCNAHIKAINCDADEVELNRCEGRMIQMFQDLGLGDWNKENHSDNVPFDVFAKAVNDNADRTDKAETLRAFVENARNKNVTHVYWA